MPGCCTCFLESVFLAIVCMSLYSCWLKQFSHLCFGSWFAPVWRMAFHTKTVGTGSSKSHFAMHKTATCRGLKPALRTASPCPSTNSDSLAVAPPCRALFAMESVMEMDELCAHLDFVSQELPEPFVCPRSTRQQSPPPPFSAEKEHGGALPPPRQRGAPRGGSGPELSLSGELGVCVARASPLPLAFWMDVHGC